MFFFKGKDIEWEGVTDPHVAAGVLMAYLLQLPDPLIPFDLYDFFITVEGKGFSSLSISLFKLNTLLLTPPTFTEKDVKEYSERCGHLRTLLKLIPQSNQDTLLAIVTLMVKITKHRPLNMMGPENLAIVFGPGFMRKKEDTISQLMHDSPIIIFVVTTLIVQFEFLFFVRIIRPSMSLNLSILPSIETLNLQTTNK